MSPATRESLRQLAPLLQPAIAHELTALIDADSLAHHYLEVEQRARRAEDLVDELRSHLATRDRQVDELPDEQRRRSLRERLDAGRAKVR